MTDSLERPGVYEDGGLVYYRASALGGCTRALALARQGYAPIGPGEKMAAVFAAGHEAERQVFRKGIVAGRAQQHVELKITDSIYVVGHMDSWWNDKIYEIKSQVESEFVPIRESRLWTRYSYQISCYMHGTGLPLVVLRAMRDKEGNVLRTEEELFETPPLALRDIRARILEVEHLARKDLTEVECEQTYPCPYFYTHPRIDEQREYIDEAGCRVLVDEYRSARDDERNAKARRKLAQQGILAYLGDRSRVEVAGGVLVTRYEVKPRHVEYDSPGYTSIRVTDKKEKKTAGDDAKESGDQEG